MKWEFDDGGRELSGFSGLVGDCVVRSIAIAMNKPYLDVYDEINRLAKEESIKRGRKKSSARNGVRRSVYERYLNNADWKWTPTMGIGTGCKFHLRDGELPMGRLIVSVSKHLTCLIDGVIHDTFDPSRDGNRCVYGYWVKA